jgi:hypothetical protein
MMERCLTRMEIATVADFIMDNYVILGSGLIDHVIECKECQLDVMEIVEIMTSCDDEEEEEESVGWQFPTCCQ